MQQNEFFANLDDRNRVVLSLGFHKWCFISIDVDYEEIGEQARNSEKYTRTHQKLKCINSGWSFQRALSNHSMFYRPVLFVVFWQ